MGNILRLSKLFVQESFSELSKQLYVNCGVSFKLSDSLSVGEVEVYGDSSGYAVNVNIGIGKIKEENTLVSDEYFVDVIISMYHAQIHCIQKNRVFRESNLDEFMERQLIQEIACIGNAEYYLNNYYINANEIQAEYYGILETYNYLCDTFPWVDSKQLENIICNVINSKMRISSYFVNKLKLFTSLSVIDNTFNEVYMHSFNVKRRYFI